MHVFSFRVLGFLLILGIIGAGLGLQTVSAYDSPIVADHTRTDLSSVPAAAITTAKNTLKIAYGHTSHGSQLVTGMSALAAHDSFYAFNNTGSGGVLKLHDYAMGGDVGYYPDWVNNTRSYLGTPDPETGRGQSKPDINVIIWSWCGQASGLSEQQMIERYLAPMTQLEIEYPGIVFVYMTGHLDGSGADGNLNARNDQIRNYVHANNKVLFDFADIDGHDPGGQTNFMPLFCDDGCNYDSNGDKQRDSNWASQWLSANPGSDLAHLVTTHCGDCAHSEKLNCVQKGRAAWWLWARLAGWNGNDPVNGVCGSSNEGVFPTIPTENLCSAGNASPVSGTGNPWSWTCAGLNGGSSASCSATDHAFLTVARTGAGSGNVVSNPAGISCGVNCGASFSAGMSVELTANADAGSDISGWGGDCGHCPWTHNSCNVTINAAKNCTVDFSPAFALDVSKTGGGSGTVTDNRGRIDCGSDCSGSYGSGQNVILTPIPSGGSVFGGWSGGGCSGTGSCTISMDGPKDVTAFFYVTPEVDVHAEVICPVSVKALSQALTVGVKVHNNTCGVPVTFTKANALLLFNGGSLANLGIAGPKRTGLAQSITAPAASCTGTVASGISSQFPVAVVNALSDALVGTSVQVMIEALSHDSHVIASGECMVPVIP